MSWPDSLIFVSTLCLVAHRTHPPTRTHDQTTEPDTPDTAATHALVVGPSFTLAAIARYSNTQHKICSHQTAPASVLPCSRCSAAFFFIVCFCRCSACSLCYMSVRDALHNLIAALSQPNAIYHELCASPQSDGWLTKRLVRFREKHTAFSMDKKRTKNGTNPNVQR